MSMNEQWIFTAGISLLENLKHPEKLNDLALAAAFRFKNPSDWVRIMQPALSADLRQQLVKFAIPFAQLDLADRDERAKTTAELASYLLLRQTRQKAPTRLILLASQTGPGLFCSLVNAMLLGEQVRCFDKLDTLLPEHAAPQPRLTVPGFNPAELQQGGSKAPYPLHPTLQQSALPTVDLVMIEKLDPTDPNLFRSVAIPNLITAIARLHFNCPEGTVTVLNYTGGYKAAIPTLTQAVSLAGELAMVGLHEEADQLVQQQLVPIQLAERTESNLYWAGRGANLRNTYGVGSNQRDLLDPQHGGYATWTELRRVLYGEEFPFYEGDAQDKPRLSTLGQAVQAMISARRVWLERRQQ